MATASTKNKQRFSACFSGRSSRNNSTSNLSQTSSSSRLSDPPQEHVSAFASLPLGDRPVSPGRVALPAINTSIATEMSVPQDSEPPRPSSSNSWVSGAGRPPSSDGSLSRPESREGSRSRPSTPNTLVVPGNTVSPLTSSRSRIPSSSKLSKRRSWLPAKTDKPSVEPEQLQKPKAWIAGLREHVPYDLTPLIYGHKVPELWDERGDTLVYLFPQYAARGASFRISSTLFAASQDLFNMSRGESPRGQASNQQAMEPQNLSEVAPNLSCTAQDELAHVTLPAANVTTLAGFSYYWRRGTHEEKHLYLPLDLESDFTLPTAQLQGDDLELLVLYRNTFAFLLGGSLIATPRQVVLYPIFMGIGSILRIFGFSNKDGSTLGEVVSTSFSKYCAELRLADVRGSREKTIEAIVLGEQMKSWSLYNEAFVHAAGKLLETKRIDSPKYRQITAVTRNRLERASLDLEGRLRTVRHKLEDFDFPSMFAGIGNSQEAIEAKMVRFKAWKAAFATFRKHTIAYYREQYGAWPPKAKSKKNDFEETGLNRLLLKEIYQDFADLYDMLADRTSLTNRTIDMLSSIPDKDINDLDESIEYAIRGVESEYDRSTPPVLPPVPFDTPLLPKLSASFNRAHVLDPQKDSKNRSRRLKDNEVTDMLLGAYNRESMKPTPWLEAFLRLERQSGQGRTVEEITETRCGQWLFMYAVLQSLPICVVDAPDLAFTKRVEYFLCMSPRGGRPWMKEDSSQSRSWNNIASGGGIVSLPAGVIDHSVEGIYRRSHCWQVAAQWAAGSGNMSPATQISLGAAFPPSPIIGGRSPRVSPQLSPYPTPTVSPHLSPGSMLISSDASLERGRGRGRSPSHLSSLGLDLEELPSSGSFATESLQRPVSVHDPNLTFDTILSNISSPKQGKQ